MNRLMIAYENGTIGVETYHLAESAINEAKKLVPKVNAHPYSIIGLRIDFADGACAVYNSTQKSDCLTQAPNVAYFIDSYGNEVTPNSSIIIEKHYRFDYLCDKAKVIWNPAQGMYMFMPENSRGVHDFQDVASFKVIK